MSNRPDRPRRHRGRRSPDDILSVATFVEAAVFALEMPGALGGCEEILAITGANDRVVRMIIDRATAIRTGRTDRFPAPELRRQARQISDADRATATATARTDRCSTRDYPRAGIVTVTLPLSP